MTAPEMRMESAGQMNPKQIKVLLFGASGVLGTAVWRVCARLLAV